MSIKKNPIRIPHHESIFPAQEKTGQLSPQQRTFLATCQPQHALNGCRLKEPRPVTPSPPFMSKEKRPQLSETQNNSLRT